MFDLSLMLHFCEMLASIVECIEVAKYPFVVHVKNYDNFRVHQYHSAPGFSKTCTLLRKIDRQFD
jgi:hypothetical protein